MSEIDRIFQRHAAWHKSLLRLSWEEKIRMAEAVMPTIRALRRQRQQPPKEPAQRGKSS
jgi:hypothetical protein